MKKTVLIFFIFNLLIINKIIAQMPIRFMTEYYQFGYGERHVRLYDEANNKISSEKYKEINAFSEGVARAYVIDVGNRNVVYLNEKGEKINENFYLSGGTCKDGLIAVRIAENKYEYINKNGKKAFEGTFYNASNFREGYAIVAKTTDEIAIIDKKGKFCFEKQLKKIKEKSGKLSMPYVYDNTNYGNFRGGVLVITNVAGKSQFLLNKKGSVLEMPQTTGKNQEKYVDKRDTIPRFNFWLTEGTQLGGYYSEIAKYNLFNQKNKFIGVFTSVVHLRQGLFAVRNEKEENYFIDINGKKISETISPNSDVFCNDDYLLLHTKDTIYREPDLDTIYRKPNFKVFDKKMKEIKIKEQQQIDANDYNNIITLENDINLITKWNFSFITSDTPMESLVVYKDSMNKINEDRPIIIKNKGKFGAINWQGKLIIPCEYDSLPDFRGNYWTTAIKNGKSVKITRNNKILANEEIYGIFQKRNGKWSADGILPFEFDTPPELFIDGEEIYNPLFMGSTRKIICIAKKNAKFGLFERNEKEKFVNVLAHEYDDISVDYGGKYAVTNKNGNLDKINLTDFNSIYPAGYEGYEEISLGEVQHLIVSKNKKKGILRLLDKKLIIPCEYDSLLIKSEEYGFIYAYKNNKMGLLNLQGEIVLPLEYDSDKETSSAEKKPYLIVAKNKKKGVLRFSDGKLVIPCDYDAYEETNFGMESEYYGEKKYLIVIKDKKKGISRLSDGKLIVPCEYDYFRERESDHNYTYAYKNGKVGLLDSTGKLVIPCEYDNVNDTYSDKGAFLIFTKNNKQSVVGVQNKIVIPLIYDEIGVFYIDGRPIAVQKNGKWGFLDKNMKLFIPVQYEGRWVNFQVSRLLPKGYYFAIVSKKGKTGVIDNNNKVLIPFEYDDIYYKYDANDTKEPLFIARKGTIETPFYWNGKTVSKTPKK